MPRLFAGRTPAPSLAAAAALCLAASPAAFAGHGFNLAGFGAESLGMAGADIAVSADSAAVNINPAGLTQLPAPRWDVYTSPFQSLSTGHKDGYGNDAGMDNPLGTTSGFSYARPFTSSLYGGIGLFVQGGTGFKYGDLETKFGTTDQASAIFGVFRLAPALAWKIDDAWSVGASVSVSYAQAREKLFPETSATDPDTQQPFFGVRFDGGETFSPGGKLGLMWHGQRTTVGLTYGMKSKLDLDGGTATINYDLIGLGRVKYHDAELTGLGLPREAGIGVAWRPDDRWTLVGEFLWLDWSGCLKDSHLKMKDPDAAVPDALRSIDAVSSIDWRDQYVFALAFKYRWDDRTVVRAGIDVENNPIPRRTMSPLLNLGQRQEIAAGFTRRWSETKDWSMAIQFQPLQSYTYTNPELPFGTNARERYEVVILTIAMSWR